MRPLIVVGLFFIGGSAALAQGMPNPTALVLPGCGAVSSACPLPTSGAGGGGGGGAITAASGSYAAGALADGASVNIGSLADAPYAGSGNASLTAALKGIYALNATGLARSSAGTSAATALPVQGVNGGVAVPVSAAALPLPSGAATSANQTAVQSPAGSGAGTADAVQGVSGGVPVPVSAAALPLPVGAATAANQTNVQTAAGTAATTLQGVQGSASGVPLPISSADGGLSTIGTKADPAYTSGSGTEVSIDKGIFGLIGTTNTDLTTANGYLSTLAASLYAQSGAITGEVGPLIMTAGSASTNQPLIEDASQNLRIVLYSGSTAVSTAPNSGSGSFLPALYGACRYNTTPATITTGNSYIPQCTSTGAVHLTPEPSADADVGIAPVVSSALEICHVLKASAGNLYSLTGINTSAGALYLQLFNTAAAPSAGAAPTLGSYPIAANGQVNWTAGGGPPMKGTTGITACLSSTIATYTAATAVGWYNAMVE